MTSCQRVGRQQTQNMIYLPKKYDKRVDAKIISQKIKTMNNSFLGKLAKKQYIL